jgi:hypothetical protein
VPIAVPISTALAALAGLPAVLGVWIGGCVYNALLAALFLAFGAGAIAQVVYGVSRLILRQSHADAERGSRSHPAHPYSGKRMSKRCLMKKPMASMGLGWMPEPLFC